MDIKLYYGINTCRNEYHKKIRIERMIKECERIADESFMHARDIELMCQQMIVNDNQFSYGEVSNCVYTCVKSMMNTRNKLRCVSRIYIQRALALKKELRGI